MISDSSAKSYLFIIEQTFNPGSVNNLEFAFTLNTNGSNYLDAWASDAGRQPAVQIRENEVMQVAFICDTASDGRNCIGEQNPFFQKNALQLQLFELEQEILLQAQSLADKHRSSFREERWVMSKEDLARFKSADAKRLGSSGFAA